MEGCQSSESVIYGQKEYTEILLNGSDNSASEKEGPKTDPNKVYVSSLDDDDEIVEEWPLTCEEKEIPKTVHCASLHDKYVSKTILKPGIRGLRPHRQSVCSFVIEKVRLLDPMFSDIVSRSSVFAPDKINTVSSLQIGTSSTELSRAFELALLDMFQDEQSQITLNVSNRTGKLKDQPVLPSPCLRCIVTLQKVDLPSASDASVKSSQVLSLSDDGEKDCFSIALNEKAFGVELFRAKQYVDAFHRFATGAKTLMTLDSFLLEGKETNKEVSFLYSTLCSNMAECQLKENNPTKALSLCKRALDHDPCSVKALYRQALAAWSLGDVDLAHFSLQKLFELDPHNQAAKQLDNEVKLKIKEYDDEYTKMMKRIFNAK